MRVQRQKRRPAAIRDGVVPEASRWTQEHSYGDRFIILFRKQLRARPEAGEPIVLRHAPLFYSPAPNPFKLVTAN